MAVIHYILTAGVVGALLLGAYAIYDNRRMRSLIGEILKMRTETTGTALQDAPVEPKGRKKDGRPGTVYRPLTDEEEWALFHSKTGYAELDKPTQAEARRVVENIERTRVVGEG